MTTIRKQLEANLAPSAKGFTATITTDTLDRDGEIVMPDGMNSKEYESNPVLFWNHDAEQPIGRALSLTRKGNAIVGEFQFAQRPENFQGSYFPEFVASLVGQGIVRGVSIGYIPEPNGTRHANDLDRKKYGTTVRTVYSRWKLLEVSIAPLQANPEAVVTAIKKGFVSALDAKRWLGVATGTRTSIVVQLPPASSKKTASTMDVASIVRAEMARARGRISL